MDSGDVASVVIDAVQASCHSHASLFRPRGMSESLGAINNACVSVSKVASVNDELFVKVFDSSFAC